MKLPDNASLLTEKNSNVLSDIPALQRGQQFNGTAAETTFAISRFRNNIDKNYWSGSILALQFRLEYDKAILEIGLQINKLFLFEFLNMVEIKIWS